MAFLKRLAAAAVAVERSVARGVAEVARAPEPTRAPAYFSEFQEVLCSAASQGAKGFTGLAERITEACGNGLWGLFKTWRGAGGLAAVLAVGWFARAPLGRLMERGGPLGVAQGLGPEMDRAIENLFEPRAKVADCLKCPMTGRVFIDPVLTPTGRSYERSAIEEWIGKEGRDPVSHAPLASGQLVPNLLIRQAVESLPQPARN